jgi:hypothetical protein
VNVSTHKQDPGTIEITDPAQLPDGIGRMKTGGSRPAAKTVYTWTQTAKGSGKDPVSYKVWWWKVKDEVKP